MSIAASNAVWERSRARGMARLVLLCLANHADGAGLCWPSVPTIAKRCACSKSTVHVALDDLKAAGEIRVARNEPGKVVVYQLTVTPQGPDPSGDRTPHPSEDRTPQDPPPLRGPDPTPPRIGGDPSGDRTRTIIEPSMNLREEEAATAQQAFDRFNELADELGLKSVERLTKKRMALLTTRLAECGGLDGWAAVLARIRGSPGLLGDNDRAWKITFDWLIADETRFARIAEGQYDGWSGAAGNGAGRRPETPSDRMLAGWAVAAERAARGGR